MAAGLATWPLAIYRSHPRIMTIQIENLPSCSPPDDYVSVESKNNPF